MSMTDYQLSQATRAYDAMIDMAEKQDALRAQARADFLRFPTAETLLEHLDFGNGPSDVDLALFVIDEARHGNLRAQHILDCVADKVFLFAEVTE